MFKLARFFSTGSSSITVYEAPYFAALNSIERNFITEAIKVLKDKYHAFVPFYLESRLTRVEKRFVVKMELLPEDNKIRFTSLQLGSLDKQEVPIENVVPVTPIDYEIAHAGGKLCKSPEFMDLDMVYINKPEAEFYVFDKEGKWSEEAVNHPALSLAKTFDEHKWYDFTCAPRADASGGNVYPWD
ncbi:hypothetical protein SteCoe_32253 [Stentor coeruleus]|uniref:Uncharacterized protein n=1 Tax=Stentor coeruleus TaxID=5963 RepID=A0A1R2AZG8_9CILI|nr:hypothetical protein SteCoe_32253 [Stentor coeruleus]